MFATDPAGNFDETPATWQWTVDATAPSVTIEKSPGQPDPTNQSPIVFAVKFSEPVTGFTAGDVVLSGSAGATGVTVTGSGDAYTVSVGGMATTGDVVASIPQGAAADQAGNKNLASSSIDNSVLYDVSPPALSLPSDMALDASGPEGAQVSYTATASDGGESVAVSCSPSSGSTFPAGPTIVSCSATDPAGNVSSGNFTVTVRGAEEQLQDLAGEVQDAGHGEMLSGRVVEAERAVAAGRVREACSILASLLRQVASQSGKTLTTQESDAISADVVRIQSVVGCS